MKKYIGKRILSLMMNRIYINIYFNDLFTVGSKKQLSYDL